MLYRDALGLFRSALKDIYADREIENITRYYMDCQLGSPEADMLDDISKLKAGMPIQYVTKTSFFYGFQYFIDQGVLIPRPETEELVHWVEQDHKGEADLKILDIGTGSGCILLSLVQKLSTAEALGIDISNEAQMVFEKNVEYLGLNADFSLLDVFDDAAVAKLDQDCDIIVSNPPYILSEEKTRMMTSVIKHEPQKALFVDGKDPLIFYKRIISLLPRLLKADGKAYLETSDLYHDELESVVIDSGMDYEFRKDMQGQWRMLKVAL